jgi:hypothetical protein
MNGIPSKSPPVAADNLGKKNEVGCTDSSSADSVKQAAIYEAKLQGAHTGGLECVDYLEVSNKTVDKNMNGPHSFGLLDSPKESQACGPILMRSYGNRPIGGSEPMCEDPLDCYQGAEESTDGPKINMDQEKRNSENLSEGPSKLLLEPPMQAGPRAVWTETRKGRDVQKTWTHRVRNPTLSQGLIKGGKRSFADGNSSEGERAEEQVKKGRLDVGTCNDLAVAEAGHQPRQAQ